MLSRDREAECFYPPHVFPKAYILRRPSRALRIQEAHTCSGVTQNWSAPSSCSGPPMRGVCCLPLIFGTRSWSCLGTSLPSQEGNQSHLHQWCKLSLKSARLLSNDLKAITLCMRFLFFDKALERYLSDERSDWMIAPLFQDIPTMHMYNRCCFILLLYINSTENFIKAALCFLTDSSDQTLS